jgi:ABC-type branched-subunit amino acid transport system ATPase component
MLDVKHVSKHFGGIKAVDDVSLSVTAGSITGLIGSNGAGKTTLFNVISGTLGATSGEIIFQGTNISGQRPWHVASLGLVRTFQTPLGFPGMTVMENMLVFAANRRAGLWSGLAGSRRLRTSESEARDHALAVLDSIGLENRRNTLVSDLAAGDLKLLEFARPLMANPSLLLLDEPAAGVNPAWLETVVGLIRRLRDQGITFLIIDHNLGFIMKLTDYLYVMSDGRLICAGAPQDVACDEAVIESYVGRVPANASSGP